MNGYPITAEEAERMLAKAADVVGPESAPTWQRFLRGLWLSGLRIGEAVKLSWEPEAAVSVCLEGAPCFRFRAGARIWTGRAVPNGSRLRRVAPSAPRGRALRVRYDTVEQWVCQFQDDF